MSRARGYHDGSVERQRRGRCTRVGVVPIVGVESSPLAANVAAAEAQIRLSEQQFNTLDMLASQRRALILGVVGSGKTLLAAEKARRLARQGFEVLLTCFNRPLAEHLAAAIGQRA